MIDVLKLSLAACCALLIGGVAAQAATTIAHGEFWDRASGLSTIADAEATIAGGAPTATFTSTAIDYPNGAAGHIHDNTTLETFLGADGGSLVGTNTTNLTYSVFRFTGWLDLAAGTNTFSVGSDDGFQLKVDGNVLSSYNGNRPFQTTSVDADLGAGLKAFELIYWENSSYTGVEFRINGALAQFAAPGATAPVPLPAGLPLLAGGLGLFALAKRRKRAA